MSTVLTVEQAAAMLQVKPNTIREWLKKGRIPGRKIGRVYRILESEIELFLQCRLEAPAEEQPAKRKLKAADVMGMFAHVPFSTEDLMREKQLEIDLEERKLGRSDK